MTDNNRRNAPHLEVYFNFSLLVGEGHTLRAEFIEGRPSVAARNRYEVIRQTLLGGYFNRMIEEARSANLVMLFESNLNEQYIASLEAIASSITAGAGRALVELLLLQLTVKTITPDQDIRLHKAGGRGQQFSWVEGISMRTIDAEFIAPSLRNSGLLRLNTYGLFMTRSFAENYPYTQFYKAEMLGAKQHWLSIVDEIESGALDARTACLYLLGVLWRHSERFTALVDVTIEHLHQWCDSVNPVSIDDILYLLDLHINSSESCSRLPEVALHAFFQALVELGVDIHGNLLPLMPMRTADRKHKRFGDVEIATATKLVEAIDIKYQVPNLLYALEDLEGKLEENPITDFAFGFVVYPDTVITPEVDRKAADIQTAFQISIQIASFGDWIHEQTAHLISQDIDESTLATHWVQAYIESLGERRRELAPIDEPTYEWMQSMNQVISAVLSA